MLNHMRSTFRILRLTFECPSIFHINKVKFHSKNNCLSHKKLINPFNSNVTIIRRCSSENKDVPKNESENADDASKHLEIQDITGGDPDLDYKLKVLLLEAEVMRQEGDRIPSAHFLKTHHWKELLTMDTRSKRKRYFEFVFKIEKKTESRKIKKEIIRNEIENRKPTEPNGALIYDLSHNNMFLRIYDSTIDTFYNWRAIQASIFGQKLVVDCGYVDEMTVRENHNCAKQLMFVFSENRRHDDPFDLYFCNWKKGTSLTDCLHRYMPTMYDPWFPLNVHEPSYLDLFPKEKLVYLTPHCREVLKKFDHDDIYIIGGIVDKVNTEPLSLAKAKKEGLRMAKLPLDYYLQWGAGSGKTLAVNHVASILLDVKRTGDWKYALRHVPSRKIADTDSMPKKQQKRLFGKLSYDNEDDGERSFKRETSWKPKWNEKFSKLKYGDDVKKSENSRRLVDVKKIVKSS